MKIPFQYLFLCWQYNTRGIEIVVFVHKMCIENLEADDYLVEVIK